jgi:hypothetical protein
LGPERSPWSDGEATQTVPSSRDSNLRPSFRLGTAARPFGWATAIGDLNTDGTPDVVVADRTARLAGRYAYRLQFLVSGIVSRDVVFESRHDTLTIGILDVDHDNDPDVVVSSVPSDEIVAIWLNDGRGRFDAADVGLFPARSQWRRLAVTDDSTDRSTSGLALPRRSSDGVADLLRTGTSISSSPYRAARPGRLQAAVDLGVLGSRAPPYLLA